MSTIKTKHGHTILVDDVDYEKVNKWKWVVSPMGYAQRGNGTGGTMMMHRLIMGANKGMWVDHINGNRLDNRRANLRICSPKENQRNRRLSVHNTSGYKGVSISGDKYRAFIRHPELDKNIHIGMYRFAEDAAIAYDQAAIQLFGDFSYTNIL